MTSSIPAGAPSYVEEHSDDKASLTVEDTRGLTNVFAVRVSGDSMEGSGIEDGDLAVISPQVLVEDGDIVAAIHEGGVTLKKLKIVENRPVLFPTNPKYKPITRDFEIQGKLINVVKSA